MATEDTAAYSGPYNTNGTTTVFNFGFKIESDDELIVELNNDATNVRTTVSSSDYTVVLNGNGGNVTFTTAPASGSSLYIVMNPTFGNDSDFQDDQGITEAEFNERIDRLSQQLIKLREDISRAAKFPVGDTAPALPKYSTLFGKAIAFDDTGNIFGIATTDLSAVAAVTTQIETIALTANLTAITTVSADLNGADEIGAVAALIGATPPSDDAFPVRRANGTYAWIEVSDAFEGLFDDASVGAIRTTLGIGENDAPTFDGVTVTTSLSFAGYNFNLNNPVTGQSLVFSGNEIINQTAAGTGDVLKAELPDYTGGIETVRQQTGANLDGTTADDTAFAAAITAASASSNFKRKVVVDGPMLLTNRHDLPSGIDLEVKQGASIIWNNGASTNGPIRVTGDNNHIFGGGDFKGPWADSKAIPDATNTSVSTAATIAGTADTHYFLDASSNAQQINLPGSPSDGDMIIVTSDDDTNTQTVSGTIRRFGAGSNVSSFDLAQDETTYLVYSTADGRWNEEGVIRVLLGQTAIVGNNTGLLSNKNIRVSGLRFLGWGDSAVEFEDVEAEVYSNYFWKSGYQHLGLLSPLTRARVYWNDFLDVGPGNGGNAPFLNCYHASATADSSPLYRRPEDVWFHNNLCKNNYRWTGLDFHGCRRGQIIGNTFVDVFNPVFAGFSNDAADNSLVTVTASGSSASGQANITLADASNVQIGMFIKGTTYNLDNSYVIDKSGNTITLSQNLQVTVPDAASLEFHTAFNTDDSIISHNTMRNENLNMVDAAIALSSYDSTGSFDNVITENVIVGYGTRDKTTNDMTRFTAGGRGQNGAIEIDKSTSTLVTNNNIVKFNSYGVYIEPYALGNTRIADNQIGEPTLFNGQAVGIYPQDSHVSQIVIEDNTFNEGAGTMTGIESNSSTAASAGYGLVMNENNFVKCATQLGTNMTNIAVDGDWNPASRAQVFYSNTNGDKSVTIGRQQAIGTGQDNVSIGPQTAGDSLTTGYENVFIGRQAGQGATSAFRNVGVGAQALKDLTTGESNVAFGYLAGSNITTGAANVALGRASLFSLLTGSNNIAIGREALEQATGSDNIAIGSFCAEQGTGAENTTIGVEAGRYNGAGIENTIIGYRAGRGVSGTTNADRNTIIGVEAAFDLTTGDDNTMVGRQAGANVTSGSDNVFLGANAGDNLTTGSGNIVIGQGVDAQSATGSNQLNIGNFLKSGDMTGKVATLGSAGTDFIPTSDGTTGGSGSAGAGNQYVELEVNGTVYKALHDGTV